MSFRVAFLLALPLTASAGKLEPLAHGRYHVEVDGMRAEATAAANGAELRFRYLGPSVTTTPLANGEVRRQIGLKLRAHDTCNVTYVTWHIAPDQGVFVSVKRNPGQSTHAECGARGYLDLQPTTRAAAPLLRPGEEHTLRADLDGRTLRVRADGAVVWQGAMPASALELDGPIGVRTDNAAFDFELIADR